MLALLAVAPSLGLLALFLAADRYEPEPRGHVAAAVGLGALAWLMALGAAHLLAGVAPLLLESTGLFTRAVEAFLMAGLVEEACKWVLLAGVVYRWRELDEPLDGLIYGVALALGFGTVENTVVVLGTGGGLTVGLLRAVLSVPAHSLFGATMGAFVGAARHAGDAPGRRLRYLLLALLLPTLLHGAFDFLLLSLSGALMYALVSAGSVLLWAYVLRRVRNLRDRSPFRPGSPAGPAGTPPA